MRITFARNLCSGFCNCTPPKACYILFIIPIWILLTFFITVGNLLRITTISSWYEKTPDVEFNSFIYSSYYYEKSASLGDNAIALIMINRDDTPWFTEKIKIVGFNGTDNAVDTLLVDRITPHGICKLITTFATGLTLPNMTSLNMIMEEKLIEIPFEKPSNVRRDVVVCISPLFVSEAWQNFIFAAHIYKRYGAYMQVYVMSAVKSFYDLMKKYEDEGYVHIKPWLRLRFPSEDEEVFKPNSNAEFRSQAASQSDCLLYYKETAAFVTFLDLDDVLIPSMGPTYIEEFTKIYNSQPHISYLHYRKENTIVSVAYDGSLFSLKSMFGSVKFQDKVETGKIVTSPALVNSTWIHWPVQNMPLLDAYTVSENYITHLKHIKLDNELIESDQPPRALDKKNPLISEDNLAIMIKEYERITSQEDVKKIMKKLPQETIYLDIVAKCFQEKYYYYHYSGRISEIKCPGPDMCEYEEHPEIDCMHSTANYHSAEKTTFIRFHYATSPSFIQTSGCMP